MKAEVSPINVVVLLVLLVMMIMVAYLIASQFGDRASDTLNTSKPGSGSYLYEDYIVPNITIDNLYATKSGTEITVRIDVTSRTVGKSDVNFMVKSYPGEMVLEKVERQLIGEGSESVTIKTTGDSSGNYYIIAEIRTLGGSLIVREGKWLSAGDVGYIPGTTSTITT